MDKRWILIAMIFLIVTQSIVAKKLGKFDLNISNTIIDSYTINNTKTIGVDYTILGFESERRSNGFIFRFGAQAPRSSLSSFISVNALTYALEVDEPTFNDTNDNTHGNSLNLLDPLSGSDSDDETRISSKKDWSFNRSFKFVFMLGPAVRYRYNENVSFYLAAGPKLSIEAHNYGNFSEQTTYSHRDIQLGLDFDVGSWFIFKNKLTCKLGIYGLYEIASLDQIVTEKDGEKFNHFINIELNDRMYHLKIYGYIALSHTFSW
ncbi:MAG: hypothetical protein IJ836_04210 [Spirochaetales bacterium]|nr:hypothetical protein [Spirochaetales bacterium]